MKADTHACVESFISNLAFPCVGAKTALSKGQIKTVGARDIRCPADDARILSEIKHFIAKYDSEKSLFQSLVITFEGPTDLTEEGFEKALWSRLEAWRALDAASPWDPTVSSNPEDGKFSLSFFSRAFYIVGMHPYSNRKARQMPKPTIVMNLHEQFETLRTSGAYGQMQKLIRRRDHVYSGSVNPMLADFGSHSEARQYSGRVVDENWVCPFKNVIN